MARKALITGITGQDGSYLAEHLLSLGYEVYGLIRRNSITENQQSRLDGIAKDIRGGIRGHIILRPLPRTTSYRPTPT